MTASRNSLTFPIVGAYFRPPAKLLLSILPTGTPLALDPEPSNPYDENAVAIYWHPPDGPLSTPFFSYYSHLWESLQAIREDLLGRGFCPEDIMSAESWHLGYLPASGKPTCRGGPGNVEALAALAGSPSHSATLAFLPDGSPAVTLHLLNEEC